MKRTRTPIPPLFQGPGGPRSPWSWIVTMKVAPSGYVGEIHVIATRTDGPELIQGSATGHVPPFVDVHEVIELLATEAMLVSMEPTLWDQVPHRYLDVSSCL